MAQSLADIETDALCLPEQERAHLALRLLTSLEESVEPAEMVEQLWLEECERRFSEVASGAVQAVSAEDMFARARAKLAS